MHTNIPGRTVPVSQPGFAVTDPRSGPKRLMPGRDAKDLIAAQAKRLPFISNCFDIGLWNQVALMAACDIVLAPHTGFAFIGQFVGTPWLALSGCPWAEYLFNGVPFYSVIPNCDSYPAEWRKDLECNQRLARREKTICMQDENLCAQIPEIVRGAHFLLGHETTYEKSIHVHVDNLKRKNRNLDQFKYFLN